ncbi:Down syndrome critical region protein 3-like protein [Senna tora]|uniref:Down syndrome critical region protein 3-like protein n=1 Tax=Senna tora TaxID=362788 RepID=A0A834WDT0_9FABA|nr:Down syndrome critical region protein 3-like protein [Senna tora]
MSVELKLSHSNRIYRPSETLDGKIVVKTQSSISHSGVRVTVKGSVNLQVRGGSAGVIESFYGVIKPIPIVSYSFKEIFQQRDCPMNHQKRTVEVISSGKIGPGTTEIPFSLILREPDKDLEKFYETFHGSNISVQPSV